MLLLVSQRRRSKKGEVVPSFKQDQLLLSFLYLNKGQELDCWEKEKRERMQKKIWVKEGSDDGEWVNEDDDECDDLETMHVKSEVVW